MRWETVFGIQFAKIIAAPAIGGPGASNAAPARWARNLKSGKWLEITNCLVALHVSARELLRWQRCSWHNGLMAHIKPSFDGKGMVAPGRVTQMGQLGRKVLGKDGKSYPATPSQVNHEAIRHLAAKGYSQRLIAQVIGCSRTTVARVLKGSRQSN